MTEHTRLECARLQAFSDPLPSCAPGMAERGTIRCNSTARRHRQDTGRTGSAVDLFLSLGWIFRTLLFFFGGYFAPGIPDCFCPWQA